MNAEGDQPVNPPPADAGDTINFGPPQPKEPVVFLTSPTVAPVVRQYPVFVPLLLLLLTLNYSAFRNITSIHQRIAEMGAEDAPAITTLEQASKQDEMFRSMRQDVLKLAKTDPVADRIAKTYFTPPPVAPPPVAPTPEPPGAPGAPPNPPSMPAAK